MLASENDDSRVNACMGRAYLYLQVAAHEVQQRSLKWRQEIYLSLCPKLPRFMVQKFTNSQFKSESPEMTTDTRGIC